MVRVTVLFRNGLIKGLRGGGGVLLIDKARGVKERVQCQFSYQIQFWIWKDKCKNKTEINLENLVQSATLVLRQT